MPSRTMTLDELSQIQEAGEYTWLSDWVLAEPLTAQALALYARMCLLAKADEQFGDTHMTLTVERADAYCGGSGKAALDELLKTGAISRVSSGGRSGTRYRLEDYPPKIRAERAGYTQGDGKPLVTYG